MGVPKFFRWASERYPAILSRMVPDQESFPPLDNFYLDMNGIIHQCTHGNDKVLHESSNEEVVARRVWEELARLVSLTRPNLLLFIAVDGVAPRAKLNQQRTRRYKAAKELQTQIQNEGDPNKKYFDSNCITPGTEFMYRVSCFLKEHLVQAMQTDPLWQQFKVIFSGVEVPGEGEHKIISYIREQKAAGLMPPNLRHGVYGADADMMMLTLATHEPYMIIIREIVVIGTGKSMKGGKSHKPASLNALHPISAATLASLNAPSPPNVPAVESAPDAVAIESALLSDVSTKSFVPEAEKPAEHTGPRPGKLLQYIRVNILREYLVRELLEDFLHTDMTTQVTTYTHTTNAKDGDADEHGRSSNSVVDIDPERVLDDFIFLSFFVGNDFLPQLPGLSIGESAFDIIFDAYKTSLSADFGYLILANHQLDLHRLELIFALVGAAEAVVYGEQEVNRLLREQKKLRGGDFANQSSRASTVTASAKHDDDSSTPPPSTPNPHTAQVVNSNIILSSKNAMDIFTLDYRALYYAEKLSINVHTPGGQEALSRVKLEYLKGLVWCLEYYTAGCVSWSYYYPYHYGLFLSDMKNLYKYSYAKDMTDVFALDKPLTPYQCLCACLPPFSFRLLPKPYVSMLTAPECTGMYVEDFKVDMSVNKHSYDGVVILPFIDIHVMCSCEERVCPAHLLTEEERQRNQVGKVMVYAWNDAKVAVQEQDCNLAPSPHFTPSLLPGTSSSLPCYPSLSLLLEGVGGRFGKPRYLDRELPHSNNPGSSNRHPNFGKQLAALQPPPASPVPFHISLSPAEDSGGTTPVVEDAAVPGGNGDDRELPMEENVSVKVTRGGRGRGRGGEHRNNNNNSNANHDNHDGNRKKGGGGRGGGRGGVLSGYRRMSKREGGVFPQLGEAPPLPALSSYRPPAAPCAPPAIVSARHASAGYVLRLVLDSGCEQFIHALTLLVAKQVRGFSATPPGHAEDEAEVTYTSLFGIEAPLGGSEEDDADAMESLVQRVGGVFPPVSLRLLPHARVVSVWPGSAGEGCVYGIGIEVSGNEEEGGKGAHLDQIETFVTDRLGKEVVEGHGDDSVFERHILLGWFRGGDVQQFVAWLGGQLAGFQNHLPPARCANLQLLWKAEGETGEGALLQEVPMMG